MVCGGLAGMLREEIKYSQGGKNAFLSDALLSTIVRIPVLGVFD